MPARFRGTSSRSASGDAPCHRPGQQRTVRRVRDGQASRESRIQTPPMAGTSQQRQGGCLSVPVWVHRERVLRRADSAGNAGMP
jgi:hypothetical protein